MVDRQQEEFLSVQENLIDSVYRFLDDSSWVPNDDEYQGFLRKWYASMIG
ncbi:hypothetical protein [Agathobacter rectalis]|jgi:hypothetical protein|nr:hypothetical protein [Agathobacter rectalis]